MSEKKTILTSDNKIRTADNYRAHQNDYFDKPSSADVSLLIVPGLNNNDENHWQTHWQNAFDSTHRIEIQDWHLADLDKWRDGILRALAVIGRPSVLIAHSFGGLAAASIAAEFPQWVEKLLLVAPADPDKFHIAQRLPQTPLPVPTQLIASSNDPWMNESKTAFWAKIWAAEYLCIDNLGHINSDSQIGIWPEGLQQLAKLIEQKDHTLLRKNKSVMPNNRDHNAFAA